MSETFPDSTSNVVPASIAVGAVILAGAIAYRHLRPERHYEPGENYFELIRNVDKCIRAEVDDSVHYFMLGGGVSAALQHHETVIDVETRRIIPPANIYKRQYREESGTLADGDFIVESDDEDIIDKVRDALVPNKAILKYSTDDDARRRELEKPGNKIKIGVTGLMPQAELEDQPQTMSQKIKHAIMKDVVSQRVLLGDGRCQLAISDIRTDLPEEYFEPWQLVLPADEATPDVHPTIPVLHPLIQVLCYPSRACHGIRKRDIKKVVGIMENVGPMFDAQLVLGRKNRTATIEANNYPSAGIEAAKMFCDAKNELRWRNTRKRLGIPEAALLATRIAIHRQVDTIPFFEQFGQGGRLYDNVISKFSRERQDR